MLRKRLLRAFGRRYARYVARREGPALRLLESFFRADFRACTLEEGASTLASRFLGFGQRIDAEGFSEALRRGHYRSLRGRDRPVLRSYEFRGFYVTHDIRNKSQWNAFAIGVHQPGVTHWLRMFAKPNTCALDIGANAGVLTLELADAVGSTGMVHAFEPNPDAYRLLENAIERNDLGHFVCVHPFALGQEDSRTNLAVPVWNNGAASLRSARAGERAVEVEVRSFDAWWQATGAPRIDVVKLDVEGFEATVLQALSGMLERDRPGLVMEVSPSRYDAAEMLASLQRLGYRLMRITSEPPYMAELPVTVSHQVDIVCFPVEEAECIS